jgi:maltose alpha-D-glucosyltransferase/alpha-amylase
MHIALASDAANQAFAPEPFTLFYQRSLYQSMRNLAGRVFQAADAGNVSDAIRAGVADLRKLEDRLLARFQALIEHPIDAQRIRCHGDYHLGQLLFTGNDFFIADFEGEPIRPLSERRLKRSALRDVAGMLRSFHYAAFSDVFASADRSPLSLDRETARGWADYWYARVAATFLNGYLEPVRAAAVLPSDHGDLATLLDACTLEKAVYELGYELNNRPGWAGVPLHGLLEMLREDG